MESNPLTPNNLTAMKDSLLDMIGLLVLAAMFYAMLLMLPAFA